METEYRQKLSEKYQLQCLQFFQEIMNLQTQIELKDTEIQELKSKLLGLENDEEINVNSTFNP